jgi:hypothetical protein
MPDMGKGLMGGGGIALLLLLLSKLFGKRGDASYSEEEIERASNVLDILSDEEKTALWGEVQAEQEMIKEAACNMAKRYSKEYKPGKKSKSRKGQFEGGHKFQGTKTAAMSPAAWSALVGGGIGAGGGALGGALSGDPKNRWRNALKGALGGGAGGAGIGFALSGVPGLAQSPPDVTLQNGEDLMSAINRVLHQRALVERASKMQLPQPRIKGSAAAFGKAAVGMPQLRPRPSIPAGMPPNPELHALAQSMDDEYVAGLDPAKIAQLKKLLGWKWYHTNPDELDVVETLMEQDEAMGSAADFGKQAASDVIPGGKADNLPASDFPSEAVERGTRVEMEHTDNKAAAREIAEDHLRVVNTTMSLRRWRRN